MVRERTVILQAEWDESEGHGRECVHPLLQSSKVWDCFYETAQIPNTSPKSSYHKLQTNPLPIMNCSPPVFNDLANFSFFLQQAVSPMGSGHVLGLHPRTLSPLPSMGS